MNSYLDVMYFFGSWHDQFDAKKNKIQNKDVM